MYASSYEVQADTIAKGSVSLPAAITRGSGVSGLSVFADADGDLWLALETATGGMYLELRRKFGP